MSGIADIKHFFIVYGENETTPITSSVCPFIFGTLRPLACELADYYGVAVAPTGQSGDSLPNYLAIVAGSSFAEYDHTCPLGLSDSTIADLLEAKGFTWKNYAENLGTNNPCSYCDSGSYAPRHVPFANFSKTCSSGKVVDFTHLQSDVNAGTLPAFAFISPNIYDDGHTASSSTSNRFTQFDNWLKNTLYPVLKNHLETDTVLLVTFDTGVTGSYSAACTSTAGGKVFTLVVGPATIVNQNTMLTSFFNHYSSLAMVEKIFGLGNLGRCDVGASTYDSAFITALPPPKSPTSLNLSASVSWIDKK